MTHHQHGSRPTRFVLAEDPALAAAIGEQLRFEQVTLKIGAKLKRSARVKNWEMFDGALLAVTFSDRRKHWILGSAVLVAPGVALCASHVLAEHQEDLTGGRIGAMCFGIASHGALAA